MGEEIYTHSFNTHAEDIERFALDIFEHTAPHKTPTPAFKKQAFK
jgi:hypothetical protein